MALALISLGAFWWLSIGAVACAGRAFLLSFHKVNKGKKDTLLYQGLSVVAFVIGIVLILLPKA